LPLLFSDINLFRPVPDLLAANPLSIPDSFPILRQQEDPAQVRGQSTQNKNCCGAEAVFSQAGRSVIRVDCPLFEHLKVVWLCVAR